MGLELRRNGAIPEIPKRKHLRELINVFASENDPAIVASRTRLFNQLEIRGVSQQDTGELYAFASLANWLHKDERRLTGDPFITHPLAVALTLAESIHIPVDELKEHCISAIGHDLRENTNIKRWQLMRFAKRNPANTIELLSKVAKSNEKAKKKDIKGYFHQLMTYGRLPDWRVKIADWNHNLETTPKYKEEYPLEKWDKIDKLQRKFAQTSEHILPLIRKIPDGERAYWYDIIASTYDKCRPEGAPDLEPLQTAA
ncbi:MAG TPA: hypothetical protein VM077_03020 [Candidatus Limnocylindrales bacterium]|nr:hypothetical protein [Candidatus Limnocylindrales bacterium]